MGVYDDLVAQDRMRAQRVRTFIISAAAMAFLLGILVCVLVMLNRGSGKSKKGGGHPNVVSRPPVPPPVPPVPPPAPILLPDPGEITAKIEVAAQEYGDLRKYLEEGRARAEKEERDMHQKEEKDPFKEIKQDAVRLANGSKPKTGPVLDVNEPADRFARRVFQNLLQEFYCCDANRDDYLDEEELANGMAKGIRGKQPKPFPRGKTPDPSQRHKYPDWLFIRYVDRDKDSCISLTEYRRWALGVAEDLKEVKDKADRLAKVWEDVLRTELPRALQHQRMQEAILLQAQLRSLLLTQHHLQSLEQMAARGNRNWSWWGYCQYASWWRRTR